MIYNSIIETIGSTPLIRLNKVNKGLKATILVKAEYFNPGNSVKDRMAIKMIEDAEKAGLLKPGGTIIEGTSGNTGMGLALVAIAKGYKCIFTLTDKQSKEKLDVLRALGAEVVVCPTNVAPTDPRSYYCTAARLNKEIPNSFYPNQYDNLSNTQAHYETTGPEIWEDTEGKVTHYAAGVGTGGTICGVSKFLKEKNPDVKTIGIDTYGSVFKKYKETGIFDEKEIYPYLLEGIGEDILPKNVDFDLIDLFVKVADKDAADMTRRLAKEEGLFVGWSSGAAVHGGLEYAKKHLTEKDIMVIILPDHGTRYLGKIYNDDWMDKNIKKICQLHVIGLRSARATARVIEKVIKPESPPLRRRPQTSSVMKPLLTAILYFIVFNVFAQCKDSSLVKTWGKWNQLQFNSSVYRLEHHTSDSLLPANLRRMAKEAIVNRCGENFYAKIKLCDLSIVIPLRPPVEKDDLMADGVAKGKDIKYYYSFEFIDEVPNIHYRFNLALDVQGKILTAWTLPVIKNNAFTKCISFCDAVDIAYKVKNSKIDLINRVELMYETQFNRFAWRVTEGHKILDKESYKSYRISIDAITGEVIARWEVVVKKYDNDRVYD